MIRKALLIGAPGAIKTKNFLEGVEVDLNHFELFLKSSIGGSWNSEEITRLNNSSFEDFISQFENAKCDYLLVYFSGHGNHFLKESNIAINDEDVISIPQLVALINTKKALIILDSCREVVGESFSSFSGSEYLSFPSSEDTYNSSDTFKQSIENCGDGITIAYSCSVGERANENDLGGVYTYSLLKSALNWFTSETDEEILGINQASELSNDFIKMHSKNEQTPQVRNTIKSDKSFNFPFAIKIKGIK
jgi:hypothetical protein